MDVLHQSFLLLLAILLLCGLLFFAPGVDAPQNDPPEIPHIHVITLPFIVEHGNEYVVTVCRLDNDIDGPHGVEAGNVVDPP